MCDIFGSNGAAQAAQEQTALLQQQQADARTRAINQDTAAIDSAFAPFNAQYYAN
jgi:hypothetical protein